MYIYRMYSYKHKKILSIVSLIIILLLAIIIHIYRKRIFQVDKKYYYGKDIIENMENKEDFKKEIKNIINNLTSSELDNFSKIMSEKIANNFQEKLVANIEVANSKIGEKSKKIKPEIKEYIDLVVQGIQCAPGPQGIQGERGPRGFHGSVYEYRGYLKDGDNKILQMQKNNIVKSVSFDKDKENIIWTKFPNGIIELEGTGNFLKNINGELVAEGIDIENIRNIEDDIPSNTIWKVSNNKKTITNSKKSFNYFFSSP